MSKDGSSAPLEGLLSLKLIFTHRIVVLGFHFPTLLREAVAATRKVVNFYLVID